jgi:hypothetical protein
MHKCATALRTERYGLDSNGSLPFILLLQVQHVEFGGLKTTFGRASLFLEDDDAEQKRIIYHRQ